MAKKSFSFAALNTNYAFELPEGLWDKDNFIKVADALNKYGDEVVPVIGFGITKVDKEEHPDAVSDRSAWIATEEELINVPAFQLPTIEELLKNEEAVEACQNGLMGVRFVEYECKYGTRVKIEWCDR